MDRLAHRPPPPMCQPSFTRRRYRSYEGVKTTQRDSNVEFEARSYTLATRPPAISRSAFARLLSTAVIISRSFFPQFLRDPNGTSLVDTVRTRIFACLMNVRLLTAAHSRRDNNSNNNNDEDDGIMNLEYFFSPPPVFGRSLSLFCPANQRKKRVGPTTCDEK